MRPEIPPGMPGGTPQKMYSKNPLKIFEIYPEIFFSMTPLAE